MLDPERLLVLPLVAAMLGAPILAWCWIPMDRGRRLAGLAILLALDAGLFAWSQLRPGVIAPPLLEWGVAGWIAAIPVLVVMVVLLDVKRAGRRLFAERFHLALLLIPAVLTGCMLGAAQLRDYDDGRGPVGILTSAVSDTEYRPVPQGMALVEETGCRGQATFPCPTLALIAERPVAGDELAAGIATHYQAVGWKPRPATTREWIVVCRPVRGILRWADHCMTIEVPAGVVNRATVTIDRG